MKQAKGENEMKQDDANSAQNTGKPQPATRPLLTNTAGSIVT